MTAEAEECGGSGPGPCPPARLRRRAGGRALGRRQLRLARSRSAPVLRGSRGPEAAPAQGTARMTPVGDWHHHRRADRRRAGRLRRPAPATRRSPRCELRATRGCLARRPAAGRPPIRRQGPPSARHSDDGENPQENGVKELAQRMAALAAAIACVWRHGRGHCAGRGTERGACAPAPGACPPGQAQTKQSGEETELLLQSLLHAATGAHSKAV